MGLFDGLRGIKRPTEGVRPRPAADVRAALLALNSDDAPVLVRDGVREGVDLVAEWKIALPQWHGFFGSVTTTNRTLMRFDGEHDELRSVDEQFRVTWAGGKPHIVLAKHAQRGQINKVETKSALVRNDAGKLVLQRERTFSSKELKEPLQATVVGMGWVWRGVSFGKL